MHSQTECLEALAAGHTLTNGRTFVHLDQYGAQVHTGYKSTHKGDYSFDSPQYWSIHHPPRQPRSHLVLWLGFILLLVSVTLIALVVAFDQLQKENTLLQQRHSELYNEFDQLQKTLTAYQTTEQQLIELGASPDQAKAIIQASEVYNLDPKH